MPHETAIQILEQTAALKEKQAGELERSAAGSAVEKASNHGRALRLRSDAAEIRKSAEELARESR